MLLIWKEVTMRNGGVSLGIAGVGETKASATLVAVGANGGVVPTSESEEVVEGCEPQAAKERIVMRRSSTSRLLIGQVSCRVVDT